MILEAMGFLADWFCRLFTGGVLLLVGWLALNDRLDEKAEAEMRRPGWDEMPRTDGLGVQIDDGELDQYDTDRFLM